jgi:hypothetical protein
MASADLVPPTIRNQRAYRWPSVSVVVLVGTFWFVICGLLSKSPSRNWTLFELVVVIAAACITALMFQVFQWLRPVDRLILNDESLVAPALASYKPADIRQISFGPDPHEDYAEATLPIKLCQAIVTPARGRRLRLIVSAGDAVRLRQWAERRGIAVTDPDGYSTRRDSK